MADSTLWALMASISLLSAISMAAFAYRLNEKWSALYMELKQMEGKNGSRKKLR